MTGNILISKFNLVLILSLNQLTLSQFFGQQIIGAVDFDDHLTLFNNLTRLKFRVQFQYLTGNTCFQSHPFHRYNRSCSLYLHHLILCINLLRLNKHLAFLRSLSLLLRCGRLQIFKQLNCSEYHQTGQYNAQKPY